MPLPAFIHDLDAFMEPQDACSAACRRPREFSRNRFVYTVISARSRGLSIGVNLNPDAQCNFNCVYCEVDRRKPAEARALNVSVMIGELRQALALVCSGQIRSHPRFAHLPPDLTELRQVTLSGDGEPTLCPQFAEAVRAIVQLRALQDFPDFKLALLTNATGLDLKQVEQGLELFGPGDEIWAKLDAGSPDYFERVNLPDCSLAKVMGNILQVARNRPVVIQSLFPRLDGEGPSAEEIERYVGRLQELRAGGAMISLVQIYSATRPMTNPRCGHLPLKSLYRIARLVKQQTGLKAEVF
jgi:wyosine [tRNA(Phe)-imidazoG37] synthetase (radical SAM superfamily)